jgi:hypothetical protein
VAAGPDRRLALYGIDPREAEAVPGAAPGDTPIRFSPDGRALYVLERGEGAASVIRRIDVASGDRKPWKEISAEAGPGVAGVSRVFLSADGSAYVYSYVRLLDELFLVDGLR